MSCESRLQKLLHLLENATEYEFRDAASHTIRDIAATHPDQLPFILYKVSSLLRRREWDCRRAAAATLGLLAKHFCHHSVIDLCRSHPATDVTSPPQDILPELQEFDVEQELAEKTLLVASESKLRSARSTSTDNGDMQRSLSIRQRNQLKRKQRSFERNRLASVDETDTPETTEVLSASSRSVSVVSDIESPERIDESILSGRWPFLTVFHQLTGHLMHPVWEVRHGAAAGLRELLNQQAESAGIEVSIVQEIPSGWAVSGRSALRDIVPMTEAELLANIDRHRQCLEECCVQILRLLVLDRMGDYLTDQMVAPVRQTASQAFACCLSALPSQTIRHFIAVVEQMIESCAWEVRHSGYVLLKYLSTAQQRRTVAETSDLLRYVLCGLTDELDDVRAAAADVLVPNASELLQQLTVEQLTCLRQALWSNLAENDDLSSATPSILHLLWQLYSASTSHSNDAVSLRKQLPLLFPFFAHPLAAVRTSAVQCFHQLLHFHREIHIFFFKAACLLFFNLLTEVKEEILQLNEITWEVLLQVYQSTQLDCEFNGRLLEMMLELASTPTGASLEERCLEMIIDDVEEHSGERLTIGSQFGMRPMRMRLAVCRSLALLIRRLPVERTYLLVKGSQSESATALLVVSLICHFWHDGALPAPPQLPVHCHDAVSELMEREVQFRELGGYVLKLKQDMTAFLNDLALVSNESMGPTTAFIERLSPAEIDVYTQTLVNGLHPDAREAVIGSQQQVAAAVHMLMKTHETLRLEMRACVAVVWVDQSAIPTNLNHIVQPLMAGIRREPDYLLQRLFADRLACLIIHCRQRKASTAKMIENVCIMACQGGGFELNGALSDVCETDGLNSALGVLKNDSVEMHPVPHRGAESVLHIMARDLRENLFHMLPAFWDQLTRDLDQFQSQSLHSLELIQIIGPALAKELLPQLATQLRHICRFCTSELHSVRVMASRCCAQLVAVHTDTLLPTILEQLLPSLSIRSETVAREGTLIAIHHILEALGVKVVPYIALLMVPLLALVSDASPSIRLIATSCFGMLISLLPLMTSSTYPPNLSTSQTAIFEKNRDFVVQLMNNKKSVQLQIPDGLSVTLRGYQLEGISWMTFLRQSGLHGILADDMGLGKTIQTLISVLLTKNDEANTVPLPSLVVCPATLVPHWCHEILTLLPTDAVRPLAYIGALSERLDLRTTILDFDVIVMSYETLRIDADWVTSHTWDYCILDEGHVIRNHESKLWRSCKRVNAKHRLILSGTPVQNGVLELWALFDFLIPGYLGTHKDFMNQYGRAVNAARYAAKGTLESTSSDLALTSLHKRVMPFILRRTKNEVLQDLPQKIIQDVYCELSPIQKALYEDFEKTYRNEETKQTSSVSSFESLQYLRKLCSHPLLVADWKNTVHQTLIRQTLRKPVMDEVSCEQVLRDTEHAPKIQILIELLSECGIMASQSPLADEASSAHRMLIFAQLKGMLSIVADHVLIPGGISHLRMDGAVPANERLAIVHQFNSDPTISVLLLTTKVGGLGLNLTSADVVVFLEHDWNPMNDLQAMDRAHRLGQKRTVNVYRILTRGTLEERIMNLQHFKIGVANSVINQDNMSLDSMDTSHMLELFSYRDKERGGEEVKPPETVDEEFVQRYRQEFGDGGGGMKAA